MEAFSSHKGIVLPMMGDNMNTDVIIPSREIKKVSKRGLGEGLFANLRYFPGSRNPDPNFVLNRPAYARASILVARQNFGCGSSREHAVWALFEYGIRVIIAESFGAIFHNNCVANGLLPCVVPGEAIARIVEWVDEDAQSREISIDLERRTVTAGPVKLSFDLDEEMRQRLLRGLSPIDVTLKRRADIEKFLAADRTARPWIHSFGDQGTGEP